MPAGQGRYKGICNSEDNACDNRLHKGKYLSLFMLINLLRG